MREWGCVGERVNITVAEMVEGRGGRWLKGERGRWLKGEGWRRGS